jgi:hypothetical protein
MGRNHAAFCLRQRAGLPGRRVDVLHDSMADLLFVVSIREEGGLVV